MSFVCLSASQPNAYLFFFEAETRMEIEKAASARFVQGFGNFPFVEHEKTFQDMNFLEHIS